MLLLDELQSQRVKPHKAFILNLLSFLPEGELCEPSELTNSYQLKMEQQNRSP